MIASLRKKRNCLYLEKNALLFINSKINVIGYLKGNREKEKEVMQNEPDDN